MQMTRRGKRRTVTLVLLMLCVLAGLYARVSTVSAIPTLTAQPQGEADDLIKRIETRYGRMRGLAADFEQTYSGPGVRSRRESGRLFLERPRRMRWEYDPKPGKLFIVNGREVWFYVPADREATHADASQVSDARFPFLFLLGNTNLRRVFRSITLIDRQGASRDTRTLRLVPRATISGLREIYLEVLTDATISGIRIVDETGATSEVSLTNVRENFIAPPEAFHFRPPPGVTLRRL